MTVVWLAGAFAWCGSALAQQERILSFESAIAVAGDAALTVTEKITVQAGGDRIKRGIFRDFPRLYRGKLGTRKKVSFEVLGVRRNGVAENYELEEISGGTRVRIGNADVFLDPGEHSYEITYRTDRQIGFFEGHDELYWNVTGNFWDFPIDRATARVALPPGTPVESHEAYTGPEGSKGRDYTSRVEAEGVAFFETTRPLQQGEGLTIVVTWAKGHVSAAAATTGWAAFAADNPGVALGIGGLAAALVYYFVAWLMVGVDPAKGVVFPLYEAPEGYSPAAVRHLERMGFDDRAFSAAVIGLAVKGAIRIEEKDAKDYTLVKTGGSEGLTADEKALFTALLGGRKSIQLKQTNHKTIGGAQSALQKALAVKLEKTHFVKNLRYWVPGFLISTAAVAVALKDAREVAPALFILFWLAIWSMGTTALVSAAISGWRSGNSRAALGMTLFAIPFVAGWCGGAAMLGWSAGIPVIGLFVLCAILNTVFYHLIKAPTHMGRRVLDQIEGFKEYLSVAEEERLNLINPPERTPELFERFLPYALALGVDQAWSEKFASVLEAAAQAPAEGGRAAYHPSWYSGTAGTSMSDFSSGAFAASLGGAMSSALSNSASAPGSSSGSSSGGGGGGSSGGGGGGGGGGGW